VAGAIGAAYYSKRVRRVHEEFQKALRDKEKEAAGASVEQNFSDLRGSVLKEIEHIEKRMEGGALTDEEREHKEHLLRELKEAETSIEKKIKNLP